MKDIFQQFYDGILRFLPVKKYFQFNAGHKGMFPAIGFLDSDTKRDLESKLGISIHNAEYFEQALIHRSYLQVIGGKNALSNERLEFLGDSILGMIVAEYLFSLHTNMLEGELTKMRSWLVNKKSLAMCAKKLELEKFIKMSYSAEKSVKHGSESILADAVEAIIAAVYIDSGFEASKSFVIDILLPLMNKKSMVDRNFKSALLETVQGRGYPAPVYIVTDESGPDHDKVFTVGAYVDGVFLGEGEGKNKKEAEQVAAKAALEAFVGMNETLISNETKDF